MIRLWDIFFVFLGRICLSWVYLCAVIGLLFTGEHKIIYKQKRVGKGGKGFTLYKSATMLEGSPNLPGGYITQDNDPRILFFGSYLRRTKVNELPQLFNILKGDMSFVGPRPQVRVHYEMYSEEQRKIINQLTPGITGVDSLFFRNEDAILRNSGKSYEHIHDEVITPFKGELERWYGMNKSVDMHLKIIYLVAVTIVNRHYSVLPHFPTPPAELLAALPEYYKDHFHGCYAD